MKKILLSSFMLFLGVTTFGQQSCAAALPITTNGTLIITPSISGVYSESCLPTKTSIAGVWYKYTPVSNGEMIITSDVSANNGVTYSKDTRLSVFNGDCLSLTCIASNDNNIESGAVKKLAKLVVPVTAGVTYYIQWDSYWFVKPLKFNFIFEALTCISPSVSDVKSPVLQDATSVKLSWNQAIVTPVVYNIDWSTDLLAIAGEGSSVSVPTGSSSTVEAIVSDLPESSSFRYFVRSQCSGGESKYKGPFYCYLPKALPYLNDFETVDALGNRTDGIVGVGIGVGFLSQFPDNTAFPPISGYGVIDDVNLGYSLSTANSTLAASNFWSFSRGISVKKDEIVLVKFKTKLYAEGYDADGITPIAPSPMSLVLNVGNAQESGSQTFLKSFPITGDNSLEAAYIGQEAYWKAPADGVYYFGINNNSPIGTVSSKILLDDLSFELGTTLSSTVFSSNSFSVSPNPARDFITVSAPNYSIKQVTVLDLNGRVLLQEAVNKTSQANITISNLSSGIYLMNVVTESGIASKKIIKN